MDGVVIARHKRHPQQHHRALASGAGCCSSYAPAAAAAAVPGEVGWRLWLGVSSLWVAFRYEDMRLVPDVVVFEHAV